MPNPAEFSPAWCSFADFYSPVPKTRRCFPETWSECTFSLARTRRRPMDEKRIPSMKRRLNWLRLNQLQSGWAVMRPPVVPRRTTIWLMAATAIPRKGHEPAKRVCCQNFLAPTTACIIALCGLFRPSPQAENIFQNHDVNVFRIIHIYFEINCLWWVVFFPL